MNRVLLLLSFFGLSFSCVNAQVLTIIDKQSMLPLESALIVSQDPQLSVHSDAHGRAPLDAMKGANYIIIQLVGYHQVITSYKKLQDDNFLVILSPRMIKINEVVISASKFEQQRSDIPQQVQILDRRELQFMNQQTTAEVMQHSGNVLVQKSQMGGGSPIIRGFEANKVLIVVDGVRMNNAIFRGGHLQNVLSIDNSILDRTEIIFGPGSVIYGSDALGGVMHFYTKTPRLADSTEQIAFNANAYTRYSTAYNEKTGHVDFNVGFKKLGFLSSITYSDFGHLRQGNIRNDFYGDWGKRLFKSERINGKDTMMASSNVNVQDPSGYRQYDLLQKFFFKQNENVSHILNLQYSTTSDVPRYDRLNEINSKGLLKHAQWYYGPQERFLGSYTLSFNADRKLYDEAKVILAYQDIKESRHNRNFNSDELNHRLEHVGVASINADFNKKLNNHTFSYGMEATYNHVRSKAYVENITLNISGPLDTRYPDGGSKMQSLAGYLTHSWKINPKISINEGVRYSDVQLKASFIDTTFFPFPFEEITQHAGAVNGNIGCSILPGSDWRFTFLASSGFRAPNVDDLAKVFESVPGSVIIPNPDLKPEYTYNAEVTIGKLINKKVNIESTIFYTLYRDALTVQPALFYSEDSIVYNDVLSRVITTVNAGEAYIYGANANLSADITENFSITSAINYTYGRIVTDTTDYPLDHIPPVFGKTGFDLHIKRFRSEFFVMYNGWKRLKDYNLIGEDNIGTATIKGMPAWYTLNIRTSYQLNRHLRMQVALENILNQNYRVFGSGIGAPGRNLVVTLRGSF